MVRRFPPPWTVEENAESFTVRDATGQALGYVYFEDEGRRSAAKLLSKDEARRIAASNIAKLPVTTLTLFRARINSRQNHDLP
jgi:hypothetical protein